MKYLSIVLKAFKLIPSLIAKFRIYLIIVGLVSSFILYQHLSIKTKKAKIVKQNEVIKTQKENLEKISDYNLNQTTKLNECIDNNQNIIATLAVEKIANEQAKENATKIKQDYENKIKTIQKIQPASDCDSVTIDTDFVKLMREN